MNVRLPTVSCAAILVAACGTVAPTGSGTPIGASGHAGSAGSTSVERNVPGTGGAGVATSGGESSGGDANGGADPGSGGTGVGGLRLGTGGTASGGTGEGGRGAAGGSAGDGGATGGSSGTATEIVDPEEILFDIVPPEPECESGTPGCDCAPVSFSVGTRQSCDLRIDPESTPDGTGAVTVDGVEHLVFAMNRWGDGHVVAWCDSDSAVALMDAFPGWAYLAQTETPRIAMLGSHWGCELTAPYPYWGNQVPAEYIADPAALAADWDVIMLCGYHMGIGPGESQDLSDPNLGWPPELEPVLRSFVKDYGKGLFLVMDYYGTVVKDADITQVNSIIRDAGFSVQPTELPWGDARAEVALECVPDVPIIR